MFGLCKASGLNQIDVAARLGVTEWGVAEVNEGRSARDGAAWYGAMDGAAGGEMSPAKA